VCVVDVFLIGGRHSQHLVEGARAVNELCAERAQLKMQLVVARVAAAVVVASEATTRTMLEAARQSAEDRATAA
jgi:hypothetical protein